MKTITSLQNQKIKDIVKLRKASVRKESGLTLVEGIFEIKLAQKDGVEILELFYSSELAGDKDVIEIDQENITKVTPDVFRKIALREHPDGFLALVKIQEKKLSDITLSDKPLVLVLEGIEKPGNIGAILRTADAAGVEAVILTEVKTDITNPNVIRASLGTVFTNQIVTCSNNEVLKWLKDKKIMSYAAIVQENNEYTKEDYRESSALVMGTEHDGLSKFWQENADKKVKIPMQGQIDSLNVSVSTAILTFEAVRQRQK